MEEQRHKVEYNSSEVNSPQGEFEKSGNKIECSGKCVGYGTGDSNNVEGINCEDDVLVGRRKQAFATKKTVGFNNYMGFKMRWSTAS